MDNSKITSGFFNQARETMVWDKRKKDLENRFLKIIEHAFYKSKAYGEIFRSAGMEPSDIRSLEDMGKIPILHMSDLIDRQKTNPPFGGFETLGTDKIRRIYINPGLIWQPGDLEYLDISWAEALCGAGFRARDRIINTFNYHMWPFAFMLDDSVKMIGATVIPTGIGNSLMQAKIIQKLKINGFMGTPAFLMTLTQRAEGMGINLKKDIHLEKGLVSAEMLPESLRSRLQERLEMTIRQAYGTVFLGCIGYECQHMTGLHVPDSIIVELVDPNTGSQVEPGTPGEIVATNFNLSYPMIRMATGDLSKLTLDPCPCGRTGPILKRIIGRIDQATKVRGTFIHPWQADEIISRYPEVFKYQVVITREEHKDIMTFVVELKEDVSHPQIIGGRIERDIKEFLAVKGVVKIVPRGTIPDRHRKIEDRRKWE